MGKAWAKAQKVRRASLPEVGKRKIEKIGWYNLVLTTTETITQETDKPKWHFRKIHLSMTAIWIQMARVLASWPSWQVKSMGRKWWMANCTKESVRSWSRYEAMKLRSQKKKAMKHVSELNMDKWESDISDITLEKKLESCFFKDKDELNKSLLEATGSPTHMSFPWSPTFVSSNLSWYFLVYSFSSFTVTIHHSCSFSIHFYTHDSF